MKEIGDPENLTTHAQEKYADVGIGNSYKNATTYFFKAMGEVVVYSFCYVLMIPLRLFFFFITQVESLVSGIAIKSNANTVGQKCLKFAKKLLDMTNRQALFFSAVLGCPIKKAGRDHHIVFSINKCFVNDLH